MSTDGIETLASVSKPRQMDREQLAIKFRMLAPGEEVMGRCVDIGLGGIRIASQLRLPEGTPLSIRCAIGDGFYLNLAGQVVYRHNPSDNPSHYGIKFIAVRPFERKILDSAIQELKAHPDSVDESLLTFQVSKDYLALEALHLHERASVMPMLSLSADPVIKETSEVVGKMSVKRGRKLTPNPSWVLEMDEHLKPYRQAIWQSRLVQETSTGALSLKQVRGWSVQFYPFVEYFPQFMATYLAKAPDSTSRAFLIDNLRVEKRHADQWIDMAKAFGVTEPELFSTSILPEVEALTHWLWSITNRGSFVEAVAATNYAIEGVTQGIASIMVKGFARYQGQEGVRLSKKAYYWMEAHSRYDDIHPYEALEIIKLNATSLEIQERVKHCAQRSLEYLGRALDQCYQAYDKG